MKQNQSRHASWRELLAAPAPGSHMVQIYDNDDFLASGVGHFTAEGLQRGEVVVLTGTQTHLSGIRRALGALGVDAGAAERNDQLLFTDAEECARLVLKDGLPDAALFDGIADPVLARAKGDARYSGVRWWGEMSNVFYHQHGSLRAALLDEEMGEATVQKHQIALLCSFLCDRYDPRSYEVLHGVCCGHSHVIPAEDYVRHRLAVNRAVDEVVGRIEGMRLHSLLSWRGLTCDLPSSQAILFWVRETMPQHFDAVLARAKDLQNA